jgi:hypothetical protein
VVPAAGLVTQVTSERRYAVGLKTFDPNIRKLLVSPIFG